jgi:iron complex transport system substrate-binding protein
MRVVSLLPSATEIVAALGLDDALVGRSEECDWPPHVSSLPVVSAARLDLASLPSRAVDDAVRAALRDHRSLYVVDEELLAALAPDLVLTQDLCAVCAVASGDICLVDVPVLSLDPQMLADVAASIEAVGAALGAPARGLDRAARFRRELEEIRTATDELPRRRVFLAEWVEPPYAPGHWLPELVEAAGGEPVLGRPGEASVRTTWEAVRAARPELVVLAPCGYDAERASREPVPAGLGCRVVAVDGSAYYARPAPRLAAGARQLAHLLHPEAVADPGLPAFDVTPAGVLT